MALPGEIVPIPGKRKKKETSAQTTLPNKRFALLQKLESEAASSALAALVNHPPVTEPQREDEQPGYQDQPNEQDQSGYDLVIRTNGIDPALSSDDDEVVHPPNNRKEYYRSTTYQERSLREEANWRAVLPKFFNAFMTCCRQTYQWCDSQLWNQDFNTDCKCKDWQKRTVEVDTIDFESRKKLYVELCACTKDVVRLIRLGYIGSKPVCPRTAFSVRLVRFHHILWKHSSIRLASFTDAIDEYLDPKNPLFVVSGSDETRDLRRCFSAAVDAYREMLRMEDELASSALRLTSLDVLAGNCPSCFGPKVPGKRIDEPDYIICLDANFQQRRHLAASAAWRGDTGVVPSLFISPAHVLLWKKKMEPPVNQQTRNKNKPVDDVVDPCSAQHTAANDTRGQQTWRGCDETGLMGMACRHDNLFKFINIIQSGERGYYPLAMLDWILQSTTEMNGNVPRFGVLYDIGCNLEKSIIKRNLFANERAAEQLKFGTSVFHSYVHQWACQLRYNPRLNKGWGLSDGEGLERIWSSLSSLVGALRYSTKAHRLCALALRTRHNNEGKRKRAINWAITRLLSSQKIHNQSLEKLNVLQRKHIRYTQEYFKDQWARQRECQLRALVTENSQVLNQMLSRLVNLEDQYREAHDELVALRAKRVQLQTASEKRNILHLPVTLLIIEEQIEELVTELGGNHYRDMPEATTPKGRALIRVRLSKSQLYGAKVDVFESQRRNDEREGTRMQQRSKKTLRDKQKLLKDKYKVFCRNVGKFNEDFPSPNPIECPTLEEIQSLPLANPFWDIGQLTHPGEAWAVDPDTRDGIRAYLDLSHSHDEIRRIGRECRQAVKWALNMQDKLSVLATALELEDNDTETIANQWLINLVKSTAATPIQRLEISKKVLRALHYRISQGHARLCMSWNSKMYEVIDKTRVYSQLSEEEEVSIKVRWAALVTQSRLTWKSATESDIVNSTPLDEVEAVELNLRLLEMDDNEVVENGFGQLDEDYFEDDEGQAIDDEVD